MSGRIFEGLASDNLLHFNLNTIYVSLTLPSSVSGQKASQLMATSLGLYMLGTAVSPVAVSLFQSYTASFAAALAIFGITLSLLRNVR